MSLFRKANKEIKAAFGDPSMSRLKLWQGRLEDARQAFQGELERMDRREELYAGTKSIRPGENAKRPARSATNVRNIVAELIESEVDSNIPLPKVTPLHRQNEENARMIEGMLRSDMDRLPFEKMNDEQERTCPIQGGSYFLVEWDNSLKTHTSRGDVVVTLLHPKQVLPQPGVSDLHRGAYCFVMQSMSKEAVLARWGVDVNAEPDSNPELAAAMPAMRPTKSDAKVTVNTAFYRNKEGGIGRFVWVNDTMVEDLEDYEARQLEVCAKCGLTKTMDSERCACGSRSWKKQACEFETLERTKIPYYKPGMFPLVLRRNISAYGKLLGDSDVDKIEDQQEFIKKLGSKIEEKLLKGGSYLTLPKGVSARKDDGEFKVIEVRSAADTQAIGVFTLQPNISYDSAEKEKAYYEAKSVLGITDSFQGKPDRTATSGLARQLATAQAAGRLESKRRMKDAAYAELFELMFKFKLAYADEPRAAVGRSVQGRPEYGEFNRYHFLEMDDAGQWYYNDQFTFGVDATGSLANNREAMWQETRMNYRQGAFGQPGAPESLALFWQMMETLHYPMASEIRAQVEAMQQRQVQMQQQMEMNKMQQVTMEAGPRALPGQGADPAAVQRQAVPQVSTQAAPVIGVNGFAR